MATEFGPASIKVKLNVEEAKQAIADLRREIRLTVPATAPDKSPVQSSVIRKTNPKVGHPSVSGAAGGGDPYQGNDPYAPDTNIADGLRIWKWLQRSNRMRKFAPAHIEKAAEDASLYNRGIDYVKGKLGLDAESVGTVSGVATTAAALYAATSAVAKMAPYALTAISQVAKLPPEVANVMNDFKNVVANLEHRVSNVVKAPAEAFDLWAGGARITGELPDFVYYWNQKYDLGVAEDDLNAKFDHFRRNEVAQAIGKGVGESFRKSFDR